jgi:beta-lactamase regulating signal transducer with metallopeptidase domain
MNAAIIHLTAGFDLLSRSTLQASILIALILTLRLLLGRHLQGRWLFALWFVLMLRLALPWTPPSRLSLYGLLPAFHTQTAAVAPRTSQAPPGPASLTLSGEPGPGTLTGTSRAAAPRETPSLSQWIFANGRQAVYLVWLAGIVALGASLLAANLTFLRAIGREPLIIDEPILRLLEDCKAQMGVRTLLALVSCDRVKSPALCGFIRPRLLLPRTLMQVLDRTELRHIFLHELAHLKRHDILVGWLTSLLQVLHWPNPLVWFALHRMRLDRELACDSLAVSALAPDTPRDYGRTILHVFECFRQRQYLPALAGIVDNPSQLQRRIEMIAHPRRTSSGSTLLGVSLLIALALVTLTDTHGIAATAASNESNAKPPAAASSATRPPTDAVIVEDLAREFMVAIRDKDDAALKKMASDRIKTWSDALPHFALELREKYRELTGRGDWAIKIEETLLSAKGDIAAVKVAGPQNANGAYLVLLFIKSGQGAGEWAGWRNLTLRNSPPATPLQDHLAKAVKDSATPVTLTDSPGAPGAAASNDSNAKASASAPVAADPGDDSQEVELPEGSYIDKNGRIVDRIDYPFVNDPPAIGKWESVDFVRTIEQFDPKTPQTKHEDLYLRGLVFYEGGRASWAWKGWTKGLLMHEGDKIAAKYVIKDIDGASYMFLEWKSGDYSIRHRNPMFYVLKKLPAGSTRFDKIEELYNMDKAGGKAELPPGSHIDEKGRIVDKIDYPFVNDPQVLGRWESVDFVRTMQDFDPAAPKWKGDLFLKELVFLKGGKTPQHWQTWTKGLVLHLGGDHTASKYTIKEIGSSKYMFFEWKSGDYILAHRTPQYYVLKKAKAN